MYGNADSKGVLCDCIASPTQSVYLLMVKLAESYGRGTSSVILPYVLIFLICECISIIRLILRRKQCS